MCFSLHTIDGREKNVQFASARRPFSLSSPPPLFSLLSSNRIKKKSGEKRKRANKKREGWEKEKDVRRKALCLREWQENGRRIEYLLQDVPEKLTYRTFGPEDVIAQCFSNSNRTLRKDVSFY